MADTSMLKQQQPVEVLNPVQYDPKHREFYVNKRPGYDYIDLEDVIKDCCRSYGISPKKINFPAVHVGAVLSRLNKDLPDYVFYDMWEDRRNQSNIVELKRIRDRIDTVVFSRMKELSKANIKRFSKAQCKFFSSIERPIETRIKSLSRDNDAKEKVVIFQRILKLCNKKDFTLADFVEILNEVDPSGNSKNAATLNKHRTKDEFGCTTSMEVLRKVSAVFKEGLLAHQALFLEVFGAGQSANNSSTSSSSVTVTKTL